MIKLVMSGSPIELTKAIKAELTKKFKETGDSVWKKSYIEKAVKKLAFGKCCFSEIKLDTLSTYTEIEHFYPKDVYPNKVVEWGNLLPSSKKCNTTKGNTDTGIVKIINPFKNEPSEYLYFQNFRYYPKNKVGRNTIDVLALNDRIHFANPRAKLTLQDLDLIENFYIDNIKDGNLENYSNYKRNRRLNVLKGYLADINRKEAFSACRATAVLKDDNFKNTLSYLKNNDFWDDEFESYLNELKFCNLA